MHVEDHPIEYGLRRRDPGGQYGSGDVIVWDRGTWSSDKDEDPAAAVENGELHIELFGEKLRGHVILVRTKGYGRSGKAASWLVMHKRDEHAVNGWDPEEHPRSVLSGRTNDEVGRPGPCASDRRRRKQPAHPTAATEFAAATVDELAELDRCPRRRSGPCRAASCS